MHQALQLPQGKTALLLVDLQEEHRRDSRYLVDGYAEILANAARLLTAARSGGVPVLHAFYRRDTTRVPLRRFEPVAADGGPLFSAPDNPMTAICAEVAPWEGEHVVAKNDASCFSEADFVRHLQGLDPEWLVLCGVWTEACLSATARDAIAAGYHVLVVKDACGSGTEAMHQSALLHLANRLYGGGVCDTATAVGLMSGQSRPVWQLAGSTPIRFDAATLRREYQSL